MRSGGLRIACVGDSLTRGDARHEPGNGTHSPLKTEEAIASRGNYPLRLAQLMELPAHSVRNFGRGGAHALNVNDRNVMAYAQAPEFKAALNFLPRVVVLMLGTNDCRRNIWFRYSKQFEGAIESLGTLFLELPSRPALIVVVPPRSYHFPKAKSADASSNTTLLGTFHPTYLTEAMTPRIRSVAERLRDTWTVAGSTACDEGAVSLLDLQAAWATRYGCERNLLSLSPCPKLYAADGIHTSVAGAEAIATALFALLRACTWKERMHNGHAQGSFTRKSI
jgi:lysophospholipase L1-like esterase